MKGKNQKVKRKTGAKLKGALIMLLECMGYSPRHINENLYTHQWVELTMDGKTGWADGQIGMADYGDFPFAVKETG